MGAELATTASEPRARGILFTGPNVLKILAGTKTQTRRIVKPLLGTKTHSPWLSPDGMWRWMTGVVSYSDDERRCPYGAPGVRPSCEDATHGSSSEERRAPDVDPGLTEQRLHGGRGRSNLLADEVRGLRPEDLRGLVSTQGASPEAAREQEGLHHDQSLPREQEGDQDRPQAGLHGLPWDAPHRFYAGPAPERGQRGQPPDEPLLGHAVRELGGPQGARPGGARRDASRCQTEGRGAGAPSLGAGQRTMQRTAGRADAGARGGDGSGDRLWIREAWAAEL